MLREDQDRLVERPANLAPPVRLDTGGALDQQLQPCELDPLERGQLEEDQRLPDRPGEAVRRLRYVELCGQVLQKLLRTDLAVVYVLQTCHHSWRGNDLVVVPALLVVDADRIPSSAHLDNLQNTTVPQLLRHGLSVISVVLVLRVRLDTPDEVRFRKVHNVHQARELILELRRNRVLLLLASGLLLLLLARAEHVGVLWILLEETSNELVLAAAHALDEVIAQLVLVLVQKRV
mmetsp:Transcript_8911/g.27708  ORF Transcript_8911/g.27708 Transcript_8911/m.27708 type:complete len:234 (-) Transcript_8911:1721-2422(-)